MERTLGLEGGWHGFVPDPLGARGIPAGAAAGAAAATGGAMASPDPFGAATGGAMAGSDPMIRDCGLRPRSKIGLLQIKAGIHPHPYLYYTPPTRLATCQHPTYTTPLYLPHLPLD